MAVLDSASVNFACEEDSEEEQQKDRLLATEKSEDKLFVSLDASCKDLALLVDDDDSEEAALAQEPDFACFSLSSDEISLDKNEQQLRS